MMIVRWTLLCLLCVTPALADELYVYGAIGQGSASVTEKEALWRHCTASQCQPFEYDGKTMGFRAGLGAAISLGELGSLGGVPVSHGIRVELGAVSLGSPEMVKSVFNGDHSYDKHGVCRKDCEKLYQLHLVNDYLGAELVAKYGLTFWDFIEVYATGGMAGFAHSHSGSVSRSWKPGVTHFSPDGGLPSENLSGMMLAGVIGGGVCGKTGPVYLCGDVEKFLPFAHSANPLIGTGVNGPVLTTLQARVPFWSW